MARLDIVDRAAIYECVMEVCRKLWEREMSSRDFPPSLEQPPLSKPQTPPFSIIKARKLLAEYLGLQEKTAGIVSILTQQSRLASQNTIDEQEAGSIA